MKRYTLKRNIVLSLALLLCAGVSSASYAGALTSQDVSYIHQITQDIKGLIDDTRTQLATFINPQDMSPFSTYVKIFEEKLEEVTAKIINPLKAKLAENQNDTTSLFYQTLKITDDLLADLHTQLQELLKVLISPKNKTKGLAMATALQKQIDVLAKKYDSFDQKLVQLLTYLQQLELVPLVQEIGDIRGLLKKAKLEQSRPLSNAEKAQIALMLDKKLKKG